MKHCGGPGPAWAVLIAALFTSEVFLAPYRLAACTAFRSQAHPEGDWSFCRRDCFSECGPTDPICGPHLSPCSPHDGHASEWEKGSKNIRSFSQLFAVLR